MKRSKKLACTVLALTMVASSGMSVFAATEHWNDASTSSDSAAWSAWKTEWETVKKDYQKVALTVGADETKLNFSWYSKTQEVPKVRLADNKEMKNAKEFSGTQDATAKYISEEGTTVDSAEEGEAYYASKVSVDGLNENSTYYYQYFQNGEWSEATEFTTQDFDSYKALLFGDPQIGACKGQVSSENDEMSGYLAARNDAFNWNITLNTALSANPDTNFLITAGDQINSSSNEYEYAGFLNASAIQNYALSTAIGNHDSSNSNYSDHYNNPNSNVATEGRTKAGTDYYYTYGNTLFVVLDTNNYNCATHEAVIKQAVAENPDAQWRVVMFHQDIYGSGKDHSDSDGIVLRTQLTPLMDKYDIDVVLQGHDHTYSRTYQLSSDGKDHTSYDSSNYKDDPNYLDENNCYVINSDTVGGTVVDPEGTVYLETNSATGSKFYDLITGQQDYVAERSQTWTPSYSVLSVDENSFTIATYDVTTGELLGGSSAYTIVKSADKTALNVAIEEAKKLSKDDYTAESWTAFENALKAAEAVAADAEATDSEVSQAVADLAKAKAELVLAEETPAPSETPEATATPDATEKPDATTKPDATVTPDATTKPEATVTPDADNNPTTGDSTNVALYAVVAALSALGIGAIVYSEKRKKNAQ